MPHYLIVKTGQALSATQQSQGDFEQLFLNALNCSDQSATVVDVRCGDGLPQSGFDAVVITGSALNVSEGPEFLDVCSTWLAKVVAAGVPTLGVCFGHQMLAHCLGGQVQPNPRGRQIGLLQMRLSQSAQSDPVVPRPLSRGGDSLAVHATHCEVVTRLPKGACLLGSTQRDPRHAFRIHNAWGVQFHPEFDAQVMDHYLDKFEARMAQEGLCPNEARRALRASAGFHDGPGVLDRFAGFVRAGK